MNADVVIEELSPDRFMKRGEERLFHKPSAHNHYASAGYSDRNVSVCPSVRPSRAGIVSKRRKLAA